MSTGDYVGPVFGATNQPVAGAGLRRCGSVIALRPEMEKRYRQLHADVWPSVLLRLQRSNIRNYSIFVATLEDKRYLFSYFEYCGENFDEDMLKIGEDPATQEWWTLTDPCQERLSGTPDGEQWMPLEGVFHSRLIGVVR